jgi:hypothetical protein
MKYKIYKRTFWRYNSVWPNGLEPSFGRKIRVDYANSEEAAQKRCEKLNAGIKGKNKFGLMYAYEQV